MRTKRSQPWRLLPFAGCCLTPNDRHQLAVTKDKRSTIQNQMKRYQTDQILWRCRLEEITGIVLAGAGVAIVWGFALNTLADQPIQHSNTQPMERIR